jgi:hypothetical protein
MQDILDVARLSPLAAAEMMEDADGTGMGVCPVREEWQRSLRCNSCKDWLTLFKLSPRAAENVLVAITVEPTVANAFRHPLPKSAFISSSHRKSCAYTPDTVWMHDSVSETHPAWHDKLAPTSSMYGNGHKVNVQIKMLALPNPINFAVIRTLARTQYKHIFANLAAQAIIDYLWNDFCGPLQAVRILVTVSVILSAMVAAFHDDWVEGSLLHDSRIAKGFWSVMLFAALHDLAHEILETPIARHQAVKQRYNLLRRIRRHFSRNQNFLEAATIIVTLSLCLLTKDNFVLYEQPELLACVCGLRWVELLSHLRAYRVIGLNMAPILMSFTSMGAITAMAVFLFLGTVNAFGALGVLPTTGNIIFVVFRLLFLGDLEGFDFDDEQTASNFTQVLIMLSTFGFHVCLLNLFIAVHGEAYDKYLGTATATFYQQRAVQALGAVSFVYWPKRFGVIQYKVPIALALISLGLMVWAALIIFFPDLHPVFPAIVLAVSVLVSQSIILQRPWWKEFLYDS